MSMYINGNEKFSAIIVCEDNDARLPENFLNNARPAIDKYLLLSPRGVKAQCYLSLPPDLRRAFIVKKCPSNIVTFLPALFASQCEHNDSVALLNGMPNRDILFGNILESLIILLKKEEAPSSFGLSIFCIPEKTFSVKDFSENIDLIDEQSIPVQSFLLLDSVNKFLVSHVVDSAVQFSNYNFIFMRDAHESELLNLAISLACHEYCYAGHNIPASLPLLARGMLARLMDNAEISIIFSDANRDEKPLPDRDLSTIVLTENENANDDYLSYIVDNIIIWKKSQHTRNGFFEGRNFESSIGLFLKKIAANREKYAIHHDALIHKAPSFLEGTGPFAKLFSREQEDIWEIEFRTQCPIPENRAPKKEGSEFAHIDARVCDSQPFVSVITIGRNIEKTIQATIESTIRQTYKNFEYIIVDGASTDKTLSIIDKFKNDIDVIVSGNDGGTYEGMNKGISLARGKYVIMMNGGDEFYDDNSLLHLADAALKTNADIVAGQSIVRNGDRTFRNIHITPHNSVCFCYGNPCNHQAMLYKKALHDALGLYDTRFRTNSDLDFTLKALLNGYYFYYIEDFVSYFHIDGISATHSWSRFHDLLNIRKRLFKFVSRDDQGFFANPWSHNLADIHRMWKKYQGNSKLFDSAISSFYHYRLFNTFLPEFGRLATLKETYELPMSPPEIAYVIGNGPSLKGFNFQTLDGQPTFGMNAAYRFWDQWGWYPRYYSCLDLVVGLSHKEAISRLIRKRHHYGIRRFLLRNNLVDALGELGQLDCIDNFDELRKEDPRLFAEPVTTGSHTLAWAAHLGFKNIVLLGIDANYTNFIKAAKNVGGIKLEITSTPQQNPNYFFADYQRTGDQFQIPNEYPDDPTHINAWKPVAKSLYGKGVFVINANSKSALAEFHKAALDQAVSLFSIWRIKNFFQRAYAKISSDILEEKPLHSVARWAFALNPAWINISAWPGRHIILAKLRPNTDLRPKTVEIMLELETQEYMELHIHGTEHSSSEHTKFGKIIRLEPYVRKRVYFQVHNFTFTHDFSLRLTMPYNGNAVTIHSFLFAETKESIIQNYGTDFSSVKAQQLFENGDYLASLGMIIAMKTDASNRNDNLYAISSGVKMGMTGLKGASLKYINIYDYPVEAKKKKNLSVDSRKVLASRSNFLYGKLISIIIPINAECAKTEQIISTVIKQEWQFIDVIVVINGSSQLFPELSDTVSGLDNRIRVKKYDNEQPLMKIYMECAEIAHGSWVHFMGYDAKPYYSFYNKLMQHDCAHSDIIKGMQIYQDNDPRQNLPSVNELLILSNDAFVDEYGSALFNKHFFLSALAEYEKKHDCEPAAFRELLPFLSHARISIEQDACITAPFQFVGSDNLKKRMSVKFQELQDLANYLYSRSNINPEIYSRIAARLVVELMHECSYTFSKTASFCDFYYRLISLAAKLVFYPYFNRNYYSVNDFKLLQTLSEKNDDDAICALAQFYDIAKIKKYITARINFIPTPSEKCCIVIVEHRNKLSKNEIASLKQCMRVFKNRKIYVCSPPDLDTSIYTDTAASLDADCEIIRMDSVFFDSYESHQVLMRSPYFYYHFTKYEYILTYQLDCWTFFDEIDRYCGYGYDFIGAIWFEDFGKCNPASKIMDIGRNGGFSLRKVSSHLKTAYMLIQAQMEHPSPHILGNMYWNEDMVIGKVFSAINPDFKIAPIDVSIDFSFEYNPAILYDKINKLPFGCHDYIRCDKKFWKKFIPIEE